MTSDELAIAVRKLARLGFDFDLSHRLGNDFYGQWVATFSHCGQRFTARGAVMDYAVRRAISTANEAYASGAIQRAPSVRR